MENIDKLDSEKIKEWANQNLDLDKIVSYFVQTLEHKQGLDFNKPKAPWL